MHFHQYKKIGKWIIAFTVAFTLTFSPAAPYFKTEHADAQWAVFDAGNVVQNTISAVQNTLTAAATAASQVSEWYVKQKETWLDGLLYAMVNAVILEMVNQMTAWINSGFQGKPAFITNFDQFLLDMGDKVVGNFIAKDLKFLCSPFKMNIQVALQIQYGRTKQQQFACKLSDIGNNLNSFLSGDFLQGGWDTWFKVTSNPVNNPYGALLEAQITTSGLLSNMRDTQKTLSAATGNFLSMQKCETVEDESGGHQRCSVTTPGNVVQDQLNRSLGAPLDRILVADEINEMLGAAFSQLVMKVLREGLSSFSSEGSNSTYFREVNVDTPPVQTGNMVADAIGVEEDYIAVLEEMLAMLDNAESYKDETYGESNTCHTGELSTILKNKKVDITGKLVKAQQTLPVLNTLYAEDLAATTSAKKLAVANAFMTLQSSGAIHQETDVIRLNMVDKADLQKAINGAPDENIAGFKSEVDAACRDNGGGGGGGGD